METTFRAWLHLLLSFLLCYYKKCPSSPQRSVLSLCVWILLLLFRTPSLPLKKVFLSLSFLYVFYVFPQIPYQHLTCLCLSCFQTPWSSNCCITKYCLYSILSQPFTNLALFISFPCRSIILKEISSFISQYLYLLFASATTLM